MEDDKIDKIPKKKWALFNASDKCAQWRMTEILCIANAQILR